MSAPRHRRTLIATVAIEQDDDSGDYIARAVVTDSAMFELDPSRTITCACDVLARRIVDEIKGAPRAGKPT